MLLPFSLNKTFVLTECKLSLKIAKVKNVISSKSVIIYALIANIIIAILKSIVAFLTRSSVMIAESIHSLADTLNQIFLLIGMRKGRKEPDTLHPFGFSSELYFWSFIVAIMLFTVGAIFSIYEGVHKLMYPAEIKNINYAFAVLFISLIVESCAFFRAFRKVNREKGENKIIGYLRKTKKSELIVVFLEDLAAITGLSIALILLFLEYLTDILIFDAIASIVIGILLGVVAFFLGNETKSLLIGESADRKKIEYISQIFREEESINRLIQIKSLQLGPEDILIAVKAEFNNRLNSVEISNLINGIEKEIRKKYPEVKKIFVEPDIYRY